MFLPSNLNSSEWPVQYLHVRSDFGFLFVIRTRRTCPSGLFVREFKVSGCLLVLDFVLSFKAGLKMGVWSTYVAAVDSTADTLLFSTYVLVGDWNIP